VIMKLDDGKRSAASGRHNLLELLGCLLERSSRYWRRIQTWSVRQVSWCNDVDARGTKFFDGVVE
jgi:hypothetical protein